MLAKMTLRTIALAVALACSFTAASQAKKNVVRPASKSVRVKPANRAHKAKRGKPAKHHKQAKVKRR
jgi:hypothetical protein